jgi:copper homeostasis protein CutC
MAVASRYILEIAVSTPDEAVIAASNGADRLELSSGLEVGGLTPSLQNFLAVREAVSIPVYVLLRPRPGGFHYSENEFDVMLRDAEVFLKKGASGIVFGMVSSGELDRKRCEKLVGIAEGRAAFHRAFDFLPNPVRAIDELIEIGFQRVLTSGQAISAISGSGLLAALVQQTGKRLEILPAGNIRPDNVVDLVLRTRCNQVHSSARAAIRDSGLCDNFLSVAGMGVDGSGNRITTDARLVSGLRSALDRLACNRGEDDSIVRADG